MFESLTLTEIMESQFTIHCQITQLTSKLEIHGLTIDMMDELNRLYFLRNVDKMSAVETIPTGRLSSSTAMQRWTRYRASRSYGVIIQTANATHDCDSTKWIFEKWLSAEHTKTFSRDSSA